jgi:hypothetical protein
MVWRKKWEKNWADVRYCSDACRRRKSLSSNIRLEARLLEMLSTRQGTLCPSEVARREYPENWREWMEPVREAARRLVARGLVEITQQGRVVEPSSARGPIRIRLKKMP